MFNNWDQATGGRGSGSRSVRAGVVPNGLSREDIDHLRKNTEVGTRQLKKLRKYELEQVCRVAQIPTTGLKAVLLEAITNFIRNEFRTATTTGGLTAQKAWQALHDVTDRINRGYSDVLHKRPAPPYTHHMATMKLDGSHGSAGGASSGYAKAGGGGAAGSGPPFDEEAKREILTRAEQDPFFEVTQTVAGPMKLDKGSGNQHIAVVNFLLAGEMLQLVQAAVELGNTPEGRRNHYLLRCYKLKGQEVKGKDGQIPETPRGHIWPLESVCQLNQTFMPLKQRKVFFQGTTRKLKGDSAPLDITSSCRAGHNRIELYSTDVDEHAILLQRVRLVEVKEIFQRIQERPHLTQEQALRRVKNSFKGSLNTEMDLSSGDDSDDDLMATATRLSLRCPVGLNVIRCPGRGRHCQHLQCFDLEMFLSYNKTCAGAGWKCGVCNMSILPGDLVVDTYLDAVVRELREQGRGEDVDEIEIQSDGSWKVIEDNEKAGKGRRDKKNGESPPEEKTTSSAQQSADGVSSGDAAASGVNNEDTVDGIPAAAGETVTTGDESTAATGGGAANGGGGAGSGTTTGGAGGRQSSGSGGAADPVVLDLSLDSDDDEGDQNNERTADDSAASTIPAASGVGTGDATSSVAAAAAAAAAAKDPQSNGTTATAAVAAAAAGADPPSRFPSASPTSSLGSTDDSGGNSSSSPPLGSASAATTEDPSPSSATAVEGTGKASSSSPVSGVGGTSSKALANAGSGSGSVFQGWEDNNSLVSFTSGQAHPGVAASSSPPPVTGSGANGVSTSAPLLPPVAAIAGARRHSETRRERYQQSTTYSGTADVGGSGGEAAPLGSGSAFIGLGPDSTVGAGAGSRRGGGWESGGGRDAPVGWQSSIVSMGSSPTVGGGGGSSQSLKRPRSNSQSDDLQDGRHRNAPQFDLSPSSHARRATDGTVQGVSAAKDLGAVYRGPGTQGNSGDGGAGGSRGAGGGDLWGDSVMGGRMGGRSQVSGVADGGRQDVMGWDDDILRNLDGLGDPIG